MPLSETFTTTYPIIEFMDIIEFIKYLNQTKGWKLQGSYYSYINEWRQWWEGNVPSFHTIRSTGLTGQQMKREMFRLRMAKKVCEDWASLLLNDKTTVTVMDKATADWLCGDPDAQQVGGVLHDLSFWTNANELVELSFCSGTGAFVLSAEGIRMEGGRLLPTASGALHLDYLPAECILPLTVKHGKVVEVAFASEVTEKGRSCVYLQTHTLVKYPDGGTQYRITNEYFTSDSEGESKSTDYQPAPLPDGMQPSFVTGSSVPWFALFSPAGKKNLLGGAGLGMAVFSEGIDPLKQCDLAFDNYCMDLYLGGKKVFYSRSMLKPVFADGCVSYVPPDDIRQQLFVQTGDENPDVPPEWHEYNPSLRTEENCRAVQNALDYASFKAGLGTHHYQFTSSGVKTATEYTGERQDMVANAERHHIRIEAALLQIFRSILWAGKNLLGAAIDPETPLSINWDDSYVMDAQTRRQQDKDDALSGFIPKYRYNMEHRGMSEEEAKRAVSEAQEESGGNDALSFDTFEE